MKKFWIIAVILAVVAVAGLAAQEQMWFVTNREGGTRAANNQITLRANQTNYIYVYFRGDWNPLGGDFDKMKIDFEISTPLEVKWQCVYYQDMSGGVLGSEELMGAAITRGPFETDFATFVKRWSGSKTTLDKKTMNGFCLAIEVPRGTTGTFTMKSVEFIGLRK